MTSDSKPIRRWRFWVPLLLQTALIAAIPAQAVYTHLTGKPVTIKTVPVDPYDLLRGYSQTLSYDISQIKTLKTLPGWNTLSKDAGELSRNSTLYVILQAPSNLSQKQPWKPIAVSRDRPNSLPVNQVALKGRVEHLDVLYGLETYYMPENRRKEINEAIERSPQRRPSLVEIKVDAQGNAIPIRIWINDRSYEF